MSKEKTCNCGHPEGLHYGKGDCKGNQYYTFNPKVIDKKCKCKKMQEVGK